MDSFSKVVAIIISATLLFLVPVKDMFEHKDDVSYVIVFNATTKLVDVVRENGYVTPRMYNEFLWALGSTGNVYDIEMTHLHKTYMPDYGDDADADGDGTAFERNDFQNRAIADYYGYYNDDILDKLNDTDNNAVDDEDYYYNMSYGDYFSIEVKNTNRTASDIIMDMLTGGRNQFPRIFVKYGGMVRNEN